MTKARQHAAATGDEDGRSLRYPLVCFDLDGTLVDDTIFIWQTLHDAFETDPSARRQAKDDYDAGRISYPDWFHHDLVLLRAAGATERAMRGVIDALVPMPGAREVLAELTRRGHHLAIISGSLDIVVEQIFPDVVFAHVLINQIRFDAQGRIDGGVPTPYDIDAKADGLRELARREGLAPERVAFIGDNYNDVAVARVAGLSVAFNCKSEALREAADVELEGRDLRGLLPLLS